MNEWIQRSIVRAQPLVLVCHAFSGCSELYCFFPVISKSNVGIWVFPAAERQNIATNLVRRSLNYLVLLVWNRSLEWNFSYFDSLFCILGQSRWTLVFRLTCQMLISAQQIKFGIWWISVWSVNFFKLLAAFSYL